MCFSPIASFGASGGLAYVGVKTLQKTTEKREILYASIPFLFAIQQFFEGLVWVFPTSGLLTTVATYYFMVFAFFLWPALLPFSVYLLEDGEVRRKILLSISILGLLVGIILLFFIAQYPVSAEIVNHSILYNISGEHNKLFIYLYLIAVCLSCLISSHRMVMIFGIALVLSFLVSLYFFLTTYISVWCFFAAVLSILVYLHFRWKDRWS